MAFIRCPQCNTVIEKPASGAPVCPSCGYGAAPGARTAAPMAAPAPAAWTPASGTPAFSEVPTGMPMQQRMSGKAIAALVLGISALCIPFVGLITGILAVVFGILAIKEVDANPQAIKGKGMAITGIVLGALGFLGTLFFVIVFGFALDEIARCVDDPEAPGCEEYQSSVDDDRTPLPKLTSVLRMPVLDLARLASGPIPA